MSNGVHAIETLIRTVSQEDLALSLGSGWVSAGLWLAELVVGLDIDLRALLQGTQVVVCARAEVEDGVPRR